MTDKTFSSSKSSSSSLALNAETTESVIITFLSLSLSLSACGWCENKIDFNKSPPQSLLAFFLLRRVVWGTNDVDTHQRKERTQVRKQRDSREFRTKTVAIETQEKRQRKMQRKKQNEKFRLSLFLSRALQSFVVRCCVWEIRILFN